MSGPVTLRNTGNVVVAVAVWIFCLVALVDGILRGTPSYILHDVIIVAAAALAAWMIFFRPRVIVHDDGLVLINLVRSYEIPFSGLVSWKVGGVFVVEIRTEGDKIRKITSWGAPGVRKQRPAMSSVLGRSRGLDSNVGAAPTAPTDLRSVTEIALDHRERDWRRTHRGEDAGVARTKWIWWPPAVLLILIVIRVAVG